MKRKIDTSINAGSMADIAFLLLLFFLVATTIQEEAGIYVRLPPYDISAPQQVDKDKVMTLRVNSNDEILLEGEEVKQGELINLLTMMISVQLEKRQQPILSLQVDRETSYEMYLDVYNDVKKVYRLLREKTAIAFYNKDYILLLEEERKAVNTAVPMIISEAEPHQYLKHL